MVQIYRKKWQRSTLRSLLGYLRDWTVLSLPIQRLPPILIRWLYGFEARFAFLVHPRNYEDVFVALPFLRPLKLLLRKNQAYRFFVHSIPFVVNTVRTPTGVHGLVIGQLTDPETMLAHRRETTRLLMKALVLVSKITLPGTVVGLGGWFPSVTRRGALLEPSAQRLGLSVTNGHSGTLISIYLTVEKISKMVGLRMEDLVLTLIGGGKMGSNVALAFNGQVARINLVDISSTSLRKAKAFVQTHASRTRIEGFLCDPKNPNLIRSLLRESHIGICATSTFRNILRVKDLPEGFVVIDDSRPEALPRDPKLGRLILEGGLLKIEGASVDYNYGLGQDENVFGCLGECFLLALDQGKRLKPTLGPVNLDNWRKMLEVARANGMKEGDLKSGELLVSDDLVRYAFETRGLLRPVQK